MSNPQTRGMGTPRVGLDIDRCITNLLRPYFKPAHITHLKLPVSLMQALCSLQFSLCRLLILPTWVRKDKQILCTSTHTHFLETTSANQERTHSHPHACLGGQQYITLHKIFWVPWKIKKLDNLKEWSHS